MIEGNARKVETKDRGKHGRSDVRRPEAGG